MHCSRTNNIAAMCCVIIVHILISAQAYGQVSFGPEEIVQAGGIDIDVPGFSVPSFVRWNGDAVPDLVIGEGGLGLDDGKVRVYLNSGTTHEPVFTGFFYVQSNGMDLASPSGG